MGPLGDLGPRVWHVCHLVASQLHCIGDGDGLILGELHCIALSMRVNRQVGFPSTNYHGECTSARNYIWIV